MLAGKDKVDISPISDRTYYRSARVSTGYLITCEIDIDRHHKIFRFKGLATLIVASMPVIVGFLLDLELGFDVLVFGFMHYLDVLKQRMVAEKLLLLEH